MPWGNECIGEGEARVCYKVWEAPTNLQGKRAATPAQDPTGYYYRRVWESPKYDDYGWRGPKFDITEGPYSKVIGGYNKPIFCDSEYGGSCRGTRFGKQIPLGATVIGGTRPKKYHDSLISPSYRDVRYTTFGLATDPFQLFGYTGRIPEMRPYGLGRLSPANLTSPATASASIAGLWALVSREDMARIREEGVALQIEQQVAQEIYDAVRGRTGRDERRQMVGENWYYRDYQRAIQTAVEHYIETGDFKRRRAAEREQIGLQSDVDRRAFEAEQAAMEEELETIRQERAELERSVEKAEEEREAARAQFQAWQSTERQMARLGLRTPYDIVGIAPGVSRPRVSPRRALGAGGEGLGAYNQLRLESRAYLGG